MVQIYLRGTDCGNIILGLNVLRGAVDADGEIYTSNY
jgi:hypothetical protein